MGGVTDHSVRGAVDVVAVGDHGGLYASCVGGGKLRLWLRLRWSIRGSHMHQLQPPAQVIRNKRSRAQRPAPTRHASATCARNDRISITCFYFLRSRSSFLLHFAAPFVG